MGSEVQVLGAPGATPLPVVFESAVNVLESARVAATSALPACGPVPGGVNVTLKRPIVAPEAIVSGRAGAPLAANPVPVIAKLLTVTGVTEEFVQVWTMGAEVVPTVTFPTLIG